MEDPAIQVLFDFNVHLFFYLKLLFNCNSLAQATNFWEVPQKMYPSKKILV